MRSLIFNSQYQLLLYCDRIPSTAPIKPPSDREIYDLSYWRDDVDAICFGIDQESRLEKGWRWIGLRDAWTILSPEEIEIATHAAMWVYWNRTTRFCCSCGDTLIHTLPIAKRCSSCGKEYFPQIAPAVIVRIDKDERTLLARAKLRPAFFGLVSGFVEGGESFEQTVVREVKEETGLEIRNLQYFGSQSWPFPSGIMVAYTAQWAAGKIDLKDGELLEADFYTRDQVRQMPIPKPFSISRQLIDQWLLRK